MLHMTLCGSSVSGCKSEPPGLSRHVNSEPPGLSRRVNSEPPGLSRRCTGAGMNPAARRLPTKPRKLSNWRACSDYRDCRFYGPSLRFSDNFPSTALVTHNVPNVLGIWVTLCFGIAGNLDERLICVWGLRLDNYRLESWAVWRFSLLRSSLFLPSAASRAFRKTYVNKEILFVDCNSGCQGFRCEILGRRKGPMHRGSGR